MKEFLRRLDEMHRSATTQLDYAKTLELLRALKSGQLSIENVAVNETGWNVVEPPPQPAGPQAVPVPEDEKAYRAFEEYVSKA
jgi:hypothetical protein